MLERAALAAGKVEDDEVVSRTCHLEEALLCLPTS
jgi:hypothetical protein